MLGCIEIGIININIIDTIIGFIGINCKIHENFARSQIPHSSGTMAGDIRSANKMVIIFSVYLAIHGDGDGDDDHQMINVINAFFMAIVVMVSIIVINVFTWPYMVHYIAVWCASSLGT